MHGPDDRVQITRTQNYPWRVHCSLRIVAADNSLWIGTGWFVGPRLLVTAGHVVYIKAPTFLPATAGSRARCVSQKYDYGAIVLPNRSATRPGGSPSPHMRT